MAATNAGTSADELSGRTRLGRISSAITDVVLAPVWRVLSMGSRSAGRRRSRSWVEADLTDGEFSPRQPIPAPTPPVAPQPVPNENPPSRRRRRRQS